VTGGWRGQGTARRAAWEARGELTSPKTLVSGCVRPGEVEDLRTRSHRGGPKRQGGGPPRGGRTESASRPLSGFW
jgi:hypothetical protein